MAKALESLKLVHVLIMLSLLFGGGAQGWANSAVDLQNTEVQLNYDEYLKYKIPDRSDLAKESPFEELSAKDKQFFLSHRLWFLKSAASALHRSRFVFGFGVVVGDSFKFIKKLYNGKAQNIQGSASSTQFIKKRKVIIEKILKSIDEQLWRQAPLVVNYEEFGLTAALGVVGADGVREKGEGGIEEFGINMGFNRAQKIFIFELYHGSEVYQKSLAMVNLAGVNGKLGIYLRRDHQLREKGDSFYPPGVPGFTSGSKDSVALGLSSSLGWPPVGADLFTYNNNYERHTLLQISISSIYKGFVSLDWGDPRESARIIVRRVSELFAWFLKQAPTYPLEKKHLFVCRSLFI